jgi:hypothetical protein
LQACNFPCALQYLQGQNSEIGHLKEISVNFQQRPSRKRAIGFKFRRQRNSKVDKIITLQVTSYDSAKILDALTLLDICLYFGMLGFFHEMVQ